jgi:cystathionine gamma-lyase
VAKFLKKHPKIDKFIGRALKIILTMTLPKNRCAGFWWYGSVTLKDADLQETFRIASRFKVSHWQNRWAGSNRW